MTRTPARTVLRLLLALLVAGAATGCTVAIPGTPVAAPRAVPAPALDAGGPVPPGSTGGGADELGVQWERVTDPDSGASTVLPAPVTREEQPGGSEAAIYVSVSPPAGVTKAELHLWPGHASDATATAEAIGKILGAETVDSRPITVDSHPGLQVRYEGGGIDGDELVLMQFVDLPAHQLSLAVHGSTTAAGPAEAVIRRMADELRLSPGGGSTGKDAGPGGPAATDEAGVYREWTDRGWVPAEWQQVQDPDSGVTAALLGAPQRSAGSTNPFSFRSTAGPDSVVTHVATDALRGRTLDLRQDAQQVADGIGGTLVDARPATVGGHPAIDVRIEFTIPGGQRATSVGRIVATPTHRVTLHTDGTAAAGRTIDQVQQMALARLAIP